LSDRLAILPCDLAEANAFVLRHHRHHKPVVGHKFSLAVSDGETIRGVAIVGRPVARMLQDGLTLEVTRVATDGAKNACSALYGACRLAGSGELAHLVAPHVLDAPARSAH
jgi:hypothetical protein